MAVKLNLDYTIISSEWNDTLLYTYNYTPNFANKINEKLCQICNKYKI